jgi:hypothetical protein
MRTAIAAVLMAAAWIGHASAQDTDPTTYPEMSQERTLPLIAAALRDNIIDPGSITNFSACYPAVKVKYENGRPVRWTIMLSFNSKNGYGGYAGLQSVAAVFYADKPVTIFASGMPPRSKRLASCTQVPDTEIQRLVQQ